MRQIKTALLLRPPHLTRKGSYDINPLPPIGLGYLAASLAGIGVDVSIYDSLVEYWDRPWPDHDAAHSYIGPDMDTLEALLRERAPDLVGVSAIFSNQHRLAQQVCALVKKVNPATPVVVGGGHATVMPREVLQDPNVDYVVLGEGEESLRDIVRHLNGEFAAEDFDGVGFKRGGELVITPKTRFIEDLDAIPFPAWDRMELDKYFGLSSSHGMRHRERFMPIITSRGCPAKCVFCSAHQVWGRHFRFRSVENVAEEMRILRERYGIEEIMFEDDNLTANVGRAKRLFQAMIDGGLGFVWDTPNGVAAWALDEEMLGLMKDSGCIKLNLAIESGSQKILKHVIRKPLSLVRAARLIRQARELGLEVSAFFIVGLPGETLADIDQTFQFARDNKLWQSHFSLATPYPGSELYRLCSDNKYFTKGYATEELYLWSYLIETPDWSAQELKEHIDRRVKELRECQSGQ